jgi:hypothetical protein
MTINCLLLIVQVVALILYIHPIAWNVGCIGLTCLDICDDI